MKIIYAFPLVGAIITLFGLCFLVVSVYDGVRIWLWGFYTVEHKNPANFQITYEKEFETYFNSIRIFSFIIFLFILFSLIHIILISIQMMKRQISSREAKKQWDSKSIVLIISLISYMIFITMEVQEVYYGNDIFIQEYLMLQKPRHALILDGNNEEIYVIKTPKYCYSGD